MGLLYGGFKHHQVVIKPSNWTIKSVLPSTCSPLGSSNWLFIVLLEYAWNRHIIVYLHIDLDLDAFWYRSQPIIFQPMFRRNCWGLGGQIGKTWQKLILPTSFRCWDGTDKWWNTVDGSEIIAPVGKYLILYRVLAPSQVVSLGNSSNHQQWMSKWAMKKWPLVVLVFSRGLTNFPVMWRLYIANHYKDP